MQRSLGHLDGVVQRDHMGLTVDPQHRGGDVLSEIALRAHTRTHSDETKTPGEQGVSELSPSLAGSERTKPGRGRADCGTLRSIRAGFGCSTRLLTWYSYLGLPAGWLLLRLD